MQKLLNAIDGKKTYIGAVVLFIAGGLNALCRLPAIGVCLEDSGFETVALVGGAIAVVGIRHAVSKLLGELLNK